MEQLIFDEAWCVCFKGPNGLDEIDLPATSLREAKFVAEKWMEKDWKDITIKFYKDGDLAHQWDYKNKAWVQYE